jgi:chemotaxis protein CheC
MTIDISVLEKDIVREIINIGLARAADSFAIISKERVSLTVPDVRLIEADKVMGLIEAYQDTHTFILSDIKGDFNGTTLMLFSEKHKQRLTEVCMGKAVEGLSESRLSVMQESLLLEISNIITGALVTQLANILRCDIYGSPPMAPSGNIETYLEDLLAHHPLFQPLVITVITQFTDSERNVDLPLFLFFDTETILKILELIRGRTAVNFNIFN